MRSVPFIVSFDTAVFTGYPVEREFLCDKAAMVGDTIKKTLYNWLAPDKACYISLGHKRCQRNCDVKCLIVALIVKW